MEVDLEAILIPVSFFALVAFVVLQSRRRAEHETQRRFELGVRTLDRFSEPEALEKFLASAAGQEFMRLLDSGEAPLHRRLLRSIQAGIVLAGLGVAFLVLSQLAEHQGEMIIPGVLFVCVGAALLGGAAVARVLAQRWDVLGEERSLRRPPSPYRDVPTQP